MGRPRTHPDGQGTTLSVRVPDELRLDLLAIAMTEALGENLSELLRRILEAYAAERRDTPEVAQARADAIRYGFFKPPQQTLEPSGSVLPFSAPDATA